MHVLHGTLILNVTLISWNAYKDPQHVFCTNDYNWTSSVTDMLNKLELDTLESRRRKARLTFMYKIYK